jgi:hypothetical protein|tara:strand:- start:359 stop:670 length:312 start_codon:yes stop_codon:yes gene_type:complete
MADEIHVNDIGTRFLITVKDDGSAVDISSASALQINFRKPSDEIINRAGSKKGDGSSVSGVMYYDTVAGDLNEIGNYKLQGKVILTAGTFYTDIHTFKVHRNL